MKLIQGLLLLAVMALIAITPFLEAQGQSPRVVTYEKAVLEDLQTIIRNQNEIIRLLQVRQVTTPVTGPDYDIGDWDEPDRIPIPSPDPNTDRGPVRLNGKLYPARPEDRKAIPGDKNNIPDPIGGFSRVPSSLSKGLAKLGGQIPDPVREPYTPPLISGFIWEQRDGEPTKVAVYGTEAPKGLEEAHRSFDEITIVKFDPMAGDKAIQEMPLLDAALEIKVDGRSTQTTFEIAEDLYDGESVTFVTVGYMRKDLFTQKKD